MHEGSKKAILAALGANVGIAIAKLAAALITGSASMLAESIHSAADAGNQGLLLFGSKRARRVADARHPFGYGMERYFWAFVVALILFSMGALFSVYEGIEKLLHPHEISDATIAFVVLGLAVVLESFSMWTAVKESRPSKGTATWIEFIRRTKNPELPVVLLEDLGALVGLVLATLGLAAAVALDDPRLDAIGSISIGLLLGAIAIILAVEMKSHLIGEGADEAAEAKIIELVDGSPEVRQLIHLRTRHLGPDELLVAAKVDFDVHDTPSLARAIDEVEARIRAQVPSATVIYLEPDLHRDA